MSPQKVFITGGTGFIGGSVLCGIVERFPQLQITALLRSPSEEFTSFFPTVKIVSGDFDSFDVIQDAAQHADIIIHAGDNNHQGCVNAILSGLSKRTTPSFLIHLTGTGQISDRLVNTWEGHSNPRIWSDVDDIEEINNLPPEAFHRVVDRQINEANTDLIKTAMICPCDVYGKPTGPGNKTTFLIPEYVKVLLEKKEAFFLGAGENLRAVVHIQDVVDAFLILVDHATRGGGDAQWGPEGFYFTVTSEVVWKDVAAAVHAIGIRDGWLPTGSKVSSWSRDQVAALAPEKAFLLLYLWGSNSRADSARLRRLGWTGNGPSFWECLEEDVKAAVADARVRDGKGAGLAEVNTSHIARGT